MLARHSHRCPAGTHRILVCRRTGPEPHEKSSWGPICLVADTCAPVAKEGEPQGLHSCLGVMTFVRRQLSHKRHSRPPGPGSPPGARPCLSGPGQGSGGALLSLERLGGDHPPPAPPGPLMRLAAATVNSVSPDTRDSPRTARRLHPAQAGSQAAVDLAAEQAVQPGRVYTWPQLPGESAAHARPAGLIPGIPAGGLQKHAWSPLDAGTAQAWSSCAIPAAAGGHVSCGKASESRHCRSPESLLENILSLEFDILMLTTPPSNLRPQSIYRQHRFILPQGKREEQTLNRRLGRGSCTRAAAGRRGGGAAGRRGGSPPSSRRPASPPGFDLPGENRLGPAAAAARAPRPPRAAPRPVLPARPAPAAAPAQPRASAAVQPPGCDLQSRPHGMTGAIAPRRPRLATAPRAL
ncbi:hypothetical protein J1605_009325 [Eschrichtius robustus]|uniref:Uncharacterized protein n=1 Tax=Eschrichtius robustus TaxID=9764 RepID=A0AB34GRV2_ESCRO|nr:hypothetical protein J1605_009325 [Eschrichtius robustus]